MDKKASSSALTYPTTTAQECFPKCTVTLSRAMVNSFWLLTAVYRLEETGSHLRYTSTEKQFQLETNEHFICI